MVNARSAALVLALVPATLAAQRGGGGGMRGGGGRSGGQEGGRSGGSSTLQLSNGDVEEMSPIKRLIDKRKDIQLTDEQVKQFKDLESEMKSRNEHMFKQLDSLRKDMTFSGHPSDDEFARIANDRQSVTDLVGNIRLSYNETLKRAMERLDEGQKQKATQMVEQLSDQADQTLAEKLNPRGERGEGGGRRGRPPQLSLYRGGGEYPAVDRRTPVASYPSRGNWSTPFRSTQVL